MLIFVYAFECKKLIFRIFLKFTFQKLNLSVEKVKLLLWLANLAVENLLFLILFGLFDWQSGEIYLKTKTFSLKGNIVPGEKV